MDFPGGTSGKEPACQCRRHKKFWFDPWVRKVPHGYPLQYSCLENPMDRGAWRVTVHRIAESQTDWSNLAHYSKKRVSTDTESPLDYKIQPVHPKGNQYWIFIARTDAEAPILWLLDVKIWPIGNDPDAGNDWRQDEKEVTEDEMVGWHHRLNEHEFEQTPGYSEGQGNLACWSPWGCKEWDLT